MSEVSKDSNKRDSKIKLQRKKCKAILQALRYLGLGFGKMEEDPGLAALFRVQSICGLQGVISVK